MKERPILFSAPMVRALLDGSKTQTRRAVKITHRTPGLAACLLPPVGTPRTRTAAELCPYGQVGDRLWVKETTVNVEDHGYEGPVYAESDEGRGVRDYGLSPSPDDMTEVEPEDIKLRPSLFMSRAMSRITLEIVSVRVERLQDISESDAQAEGVAQWARSACAKGNPCGYTDVGYYALLWDQINGAGSWDANPWVWCISFRRLT